MKLLLIKHGIEWLEQDGKIFALDVSTCNGRTFCEWVDMSTVNIYHWLGY